MWPKIFLKAAKQKPILRGHPWIFPHAISHSKGQLITGELVAIYGADNTFFGLGVYNEFSLYRVRVLAQAFEAKETFSLAQVIKMRLQQALLIREKLNLPNKLTTAFRLFNSEADGLSGLTIDCFNEFCVVVSSAYWVEKHKSLIITCIQSLLDKEIIWSMQTKVLLQDGFSAEALERETSFSASTVVFEAGVKFEVNFAVAQKTGLFLDQRENHQRIAALAQGKRVLDLYTYTGGFALHAACAKATKVTAVDSSARAIEQASLNAELNNISTIEFIADDARHYLAKASDYDIIVLDPPKLAPSQRHLQRATNYYRFLHQELFKAMRGGALLMTCNCSSALSAVDFCNLISAQAMAVNKIIRILGVYGPACCHPTLAAFPEGAYLTAVLLAIAEN